MPSANTKPRALRAVTRSKYARSPLAIDLTFAPKGARRTWDAILLLKAGMSLEEVADHLEGTAQMLRREASRSEWAA